MVWMRTYIAVAVAFTAITAAVFVLATAAPAAAQSCGGSADLTQGGGGASADAFCAGGRPSGVPVAAQPGNPVGRWNFFCNGNGLNPYVAGAEPRFTLIATFGDDPADFDNIALQGFDPSGRYALYDFACFDENGLQISQFAPHWVTLTAPIPPEDLRDIAFARIDFPDPAVDGLQQVTNAVFLESWFWVENDWVVIQDAETRGLVTVDVFATPDLVSWNPGDGSGEFDCADPGIEWSPAVNDGGTTCGHIYESGTADVAGLVYGASARIEWELTWSINGVDQGSFGRGDATSFFDVPVGEVQIVEVS